MTEPMIAIHAMVYKFQKRAWWQLSSLAQQEAWEGNPVPSFKYVVSTHNDDPFASEFHDRCSQLLKFQVTSEFWDSHLFGERGHVRTKNLQQETSEFLLYVDADMVYHKHFMAKVALAAAQHRGEHKVLGAPRMSMAFEDGYSLVDNADYTQVIPTTWDTAMTKKTWWSAHRRISGAGFFQLVHLPTLRDYLTKRWGGVQYVGKDWHRDTNILTAPVNKMLSDRNFRCNAGGLLAAPQLGDALHLNHWRHSDPQWKNIAQH